MSDREFWFRLIIYMALIVGVVFVTVDVLDDQIRQRQADARHAQIMADYDALSATVAREQGRLDAIDQDVRRLLVRVAALEAIPQATPVHRSPCPTPVFRAEPCIGR